MMKVQLTYVIKRGEIELVPYQILHPYWLAFVMNVGEKVISSLIS